MNNRVLRFMRYKFLTIVRLPDAVEKIALGVALGIAFNFLPTFGLGLIFAFITAGLIGANKMAALLSAIAVKIGIPFFYLSDLATGHLILGDRLVAGMEAETSFSFAEISWEQFNHLGKPFLLGSFVNAVIAGLITYYLALKVIERYKRKNKKKLRRENDKR